MTHALQMIAAHPWYVAAYNPAQAHDMQQVAVTPQATDEQTSGECQDCQSFRWQNQEDGQGYCTAKTTVQPDLRPSGSVSIEHPIIYANDRACENFYPYD